MIEFQGLEIPLLALPDEKGVAVLGNRRAWALKSMRHYEEIPLFVAETPNDIARWGAADKQASAWFSASDVRPWTWAERAAVLQHCMAVYGPGGVMGGRGSLAKTLADYFEVHEIQLRHAMYLLRFEQAGGPEGERAGALFALVERGELKPQSAYRKLRDGDPVAMTSYASSSPLMTAKQQEAALRNAVGVLSGVVMGLRAMGDISPDLPANVRAEVVPPVQDARRLLARIARQLQGMEEPVDESNKGEGNG